MNEISHLTPIGVNRPAGHTWQDVVGCTIPLTKHLMGGIPTKLASFIFYIIC